MAGFDLFDPIPILGFLSSFKLAYDPNGLHGEAALWLLHFLKYPTAVTLNARNALKKVAQASKKCTVSLCGKAVSYLLKTCETNVIAEMHADIMHFTHLSSTSTAEYANAPWNKLLQCNRVYDDYVLKGIFIEGLFGTGCPSYHLYSGSKKVATEFYMARNATSLTILCITNA